MMNWCDFVFVSATEKAVQILDTDGEGIWLPRSMISLRDGDTTDAYSTDDVIHLGVPDWLMEDRNLW